MNPSYPSIELLARRARQRMPGFAYDYLAGGCMAEVNLHKNTSDIRACSTHGPLYRSRTRPGSVTLKSAQPGSSNRARPCSRRILERCR
jgi:hypothetical protein